MRIPKSQIILALFFLLWIANAVFSHSVGTGFLENARKMKESELQGEGPQQAQVSEELMGGGRVLLILNLPFLVSLGFIVRSAEPSAGFLYWISLLLGSAIVPAIITFLMGLWMTPPQQLRPLPGVDWENPPQDEDDDDR